VNHFTAPGARPEQCDPPSVANGPVLAASSIAATADRSGRRMRRPPVGGSRALRTATSRNAATGSSIPASRRRRQHVGDRRPREQQPEPE
jgi:hypothetical protein